jgi:thioredoxin 1
MTASITEYSIAALKIAVFPLALAFAGCVPPAFTVSDRTFDVTADPPPVIHSLADRPAAGQRMAPIVDQRIAHKPKRPDPQPRATVSDSTETVPIAIHRTTQFGQPQTRSSREESGLATAEPGKPRSSGKVEDVDKSSFRKEVLEAGMPVLVDFYADWCGPCRRMAPALDKLAREVPTAKVVKVDIDKNPQLATKYRVRSIPTVLVFKDGSVVAQHQGLADQKTLQRLLGS